LAKGGDFFMRGAVLKEGKFVDVSRIFDFASGRVPELAPDIGGIERPVIATTQRAAFQLSGDWR
jgi:hypothetical protein